MYRLAISFFGFVSAQPAQPSPQEMSVAPNKLQIQKSKEIIVCHDTYLQERDDHNYNKEKEGYNGQHATSVNSTGSPTLQDFIAVGTKIKMNEKRCREIFDEVYQNCDDLLLNKPKR